MLAVTTKRRCCLRRGWGRVAVLAPALSSIHIWLILILAVSSSLSQIGLHFEASDKICKVYSMKTPTCHLPAAERPLSNTD